MNDIIKDAKQLLDGATPGPWEWEARKYRGHSDCHHDWLGSEHGTALVTFDSEEYSSWVESTDSDKTLIAAAPELAQALAEETYEYAVQAKIGSKWEYMQDGFFRDAWFSELRKAKAGARELRSIGKETRIVRRRVSPPEVVSE